MVRRNSGGICERETLFRMKKEANQAGFKGTRTGCILKAMFSRTKQVKSRINGRNNRT